METIIFDGKTFVKASILAKDLGYTGDYIGQLCRSQTVNARLVGRSWYVERDSLLEHKKNRYRSSKSVTKRALEKTVKERNTESFRNVSKKEEPSNYASDDFELIPKPKKLGEEEEVAKEVSVAGTASSPENSPAETFLVPIRTIKKPSATKSSHVFKPSIPNQKEVEMISTFVEPAKLAEKMVGTPQSKPVLINRKSSITTSSSLAILLITVVTITACLSLVGLEYRIVVEGDLIRTDYVLNLYNGFSQLYVYIKGFLF